MDVVATREELLGERLDVPVHAALIAPGIWRDESNAHEALRVVDVPGLTPGALSAQTKASAASR